MTAEIANAVTKSNLKLKINEKGEVDMCVAITGIRDEGKVEGALKMLFDLVKDGLLKVEDAAPRANMSEDAFKEQLEKYTSK